MYKLISELWHCTNNLQVGSCETKRGIPKQKEEISPLYFEYCKLWSVKHANLMLLWGQLLIISEYHNYASTAQPPNEVTQMLLRPLTAQMEALGSHILKTMLAQSADGFSTQYSTGGPVSIQTKLHICRNCCLKYFIFSSIFFQIQYNVGKFTYMAILIRRAHAHVSSWICQCTYWKMMVFKRNC